MIDYTKNNFWNRTHPLTNIIQQLEALVPVHGEIKGRKNRALERFRLAVNAYHDLFNNGAANQIYAVNRIYNLKRAQINRAFNGPSVHSADELFLITDPVLERIAKDAAIEQGIPLN